jgi:3-hydroxypropanoate dehydrogenase
MTAHTADPKHLTKDALAILFNEARTHNAFIDKPVPEELLRQAVDLAKMAPTSVNQSPFRVVFLRSTAAKQRLAPALMPGNLEKTLAAPVVAIAGYDVKFFEHLPFLFPHADTKCPSRDFSSHLSRLSRVEKTA